MSDTTSDLRPWFADSDEFVAAWDVARDEQGDAITITPEQGHAVLRALHVLSMVERAEGGSCNGIYEKSRLLGRMLYDGLPPTKTKPPYNLGAPWWPLLPGGDPFITDEVKAEQRAKMDEDLAAGRMLIVCHECGYSGPLFSSRADLGEHVTTTHVDWSSIA